MIILDEAQQLRACVGLVDDGVADIRPIETGHKNARVFQFKTSDDFIARLRIGSGGERNARHLGKLLVQHRQLQILRPEIMPPLRHAMRFVDGEQRDA